MSGADRAEAPSTSFQLVPLPRDSGGGDWRRVPAWLRALARLPDDVLARVLRWASPRLRRRLFEEWSWQAHGGQAEPEEPWRIWMMMAGRGFGKTRAGAEWVSEKARRFPGARIALVGGNIDDVAKVMVEGESGLQAVARTGECVRWSPTRLTVEFPSGAVGFAYSGERPEKLRGPQHHFAWCDEIAKWAKPESCWDNLMLGLRLGRKPQTVVTTTPKPGSLLKRIMATEGAVTTGGRTAENVHLPDEYLAAVTGMYAGTRLGRQELEGVYLEEAEGALWSRALIERCRGPHNSLRSDPPPAPPWQGGEGFVRVIVGVDPPAGVDGDACGIVVAGLDADGVAYVLEDASVRGLSPEGWARAVCSAAERWGADRVVAESNQGGAMVESVLRAVERHLPLKLRHASEAKGKRAEPVAALFETGRARFAGSFPELEDELVGLMPGGGYEGVGRSPDRADAMVYALGELMLGKPGHARIRSL